MDFNKVCLVIFFAIILAVLVVMSPTCVKGEGWEMPAYSATWYKDTTIHWDEVQATLCGDRYNPCRSVEIFGAGCSNMGLFAGCGTNQKAAILMVLDWTHTPNKGILTDKGCCVACTTDHMPLVSMMTVCVDTFIGTVINTSDSGQTTWFSGNCPEVLFEIFSGYSRGSNLKWDSNIMVVTGNCNHQIEDSIFAFNIFTPSYVDSANTKSIVLYPKWSDISHTDTIKITAIKAGQYNGADINERPYMHVSGYRTIVGGLLYRDVLEYLKFPYIIPDDSLSAATDWCTAGNCAKLYKE